MVRDHIPLEQGLRPAREYAEECKPPKSQRPYSIRTRIKTLWDNCLQGVYTVRDHIPLEQGLRHFNSYVSPAAGMVRDHIPLEQGLRLRRRKRKLQ